jgi:hypothetical protein
MEHRRIQGPYRSANGPPREPTHPATHITDVFVLASLVVALVGLAWWSDVINVVSTWVLGFSFHASP